MAANGKGAHVWAKVAPLLDEAGNCIGAVETIRDISEKQRYLENLERSRKQLRSLASHLQSIREEERKMITRELHDDLGQRLTVLNLNLRMMRQDTQNFLG